MAQNVLPVREGFGTPKLWVKLYPAEPLTGCYQLDRVQYLNNKFPPLLPVKPRMALLNNNCRFFI